MDPVLIAVLIIIGMLICILCGFNIGIVMFAAGFIGFGIVSNWRGAIGLLKTIMFSNAFNYSFTVVPMFILLGNFCFHAGLSAGLYNTAEKWLGNMRGGLSVATIAACAAFSAICGSSSATAATMSLVAYPEMKKYGYDDSLSCGAIAAGGTLGILIPPSTGFIFYSIITEQSVGALFAAGILPGILLALCYALSVVVVVRRKPHLAPERVKYSLKEKLISIKGAVPLVILFALVIGGIFIGFFSATEAASVGAFISCIFVLVKTRMNLRMVVECLKETVKTSAMCLFISIGAMLFGNFITVTKLPVKLNALVDSLQINKYIIILVLIGIYLIMGCLMDGLAIMFLTTSVFLPVVQSVGFSPIWFGAFLMMVCEIGQITPPVGMNVYIVAGTLKSVPLQNIFKGILPFVLGALVAVIIIVFIPGIVTLLPHLLYGVAL